MRFIPITVPYETRPHDESSSLVLTQLSPCSPIRPRGFPLVVWLPLLWTRVPIRTCPFTRETTPSSPTGEPANVMRNSEARQLVQWLPSLTSTYCVHFLFVNSTKDPWICVYFFLSLGYSSGGGNVRYSALHFVEARTPTWGWFDRVFPLFHRKREYFEPTAVSTHQSVSCFAEMLLYTLTTPCR